MPGLIGRTTPAGTRLETDEDVAGALLDEANVARFTGSAFGLGPYVRLAYALDDEALVQGVQRDRELLQGVGELTVNASSLEGGAMHDFLRPTFSCNLDGVEKVSAIHRDGERDPIVFLHGFGSAKEDYADVVRYPAFAGRPFLAFDAPGCGETTCTDLSKLSIPFLAKTALRVLQAVGFERYHLVGHSMGGLTALLLAHDYPHRVISFVNIKGNLAPEDCFLSRQIFDYPADDAERFLDDFAERAYSAPDFSNALYASSIRSKVRAGAVRGIFESMVDLSDNGDLMAKFVALRCQRCSCMAMNSPRCRISHSFDRTP